VDNRGSDGRFAPGHSGNPGGRPQELRALVSRLRERNWPRIPKLLSRLYRLAMTDDTLVGVAAARVYLDRLLGPPEKQRDPLRLPDEAPGEPEAVLQQALTLLSQQIHALAARAAIEGLSPEDSAALGSHFRAISDLALGLGRLGKAWTPERLCELLGVTLEQVEQLRGRPALE